MGYEGVDCSIDVGKVRKRGLERKDPGLDKQGKFSGKMEGQTGHG